MLPLSCPLFLWGSQGGLQNTGKGGMLGEKKQGRKKCKQAVEGRRDKGVSSISI